jgi:hypothetical protein
VSSLYRQLDFIADHSSISSDTISSHEKKRHYLECLEHYIMYLHEQLRLVGTEPVMLERVSTYRGLSSRSIRVRYTLLSDVLVAHYLPDTPSAYGKQCEEASSADTCAGASGKCLTPINRRLAH